MRRLGDPRLHRPAQQLLLVGLDRLDADGLLELEDQPGADRLDDGGRAALLAVGRVVEVAVLGRVDVHHRAAAGHDRHPVGHQLAAHDQHPGRAGTADELVRADEDRVLDRAAGAVHLDVDVGRARGEVPEAQRTVLVEQVGHALGVGDDAGDVGGRGEGPDLERPVGVGLELLAEVVERDPAVGVLVDRHDVGDGLAPRDLVGVVLEGADEHHRALLGRDRGGEVVAVVERGRDPQSQDADQLVDRGGAAGAAEHHDRLVVATHGVTDDPSRVLAEPGRLEAGAARLGVGVGVGRQHLGADEVLDEGQAATGRGVVGVGHAARAVGALHHLVVADDRGADALEEGGRGGGFVRHDPSLRPPRPVISARRGRRPRRPRAAPRGPPRGGR